LQCQLLSTIHTHQHSHAHTTQAFAVAKPRAQSTKNAICGTFETVQKFMGQRNTSKLVCE
jgi:hypothetical protein